MLKRYRLLEGLKVQIVPFCHNWNTASHFKSSHHKTSIKEHSTEVHFLVGTEVEEGTAGPKTLLQGCSSLPGEF